MILLINLGAVKPMVKIAAKTHIGLGPERLDLAGRYIEDVQTLRNGICMQAGAEL